MVLWYLIEHLKAWSEESRYRQQTTCDQGDHHTSVLTTICNGSHGSREIKNNTTEQQHTILKYPKPHMFFLIFLLYQKAAVAHFIKLVKDVRHSNHSKTSRATRPLSVLTLERGLDCGLRLVTRPTTVAVVVRCFVSPDALELSCNCPCASRRIWCAVLPGDEVHPEMWKAFMKLPFRVRNACGTSGCAV